MHLRRLLAALLFLVICAGPAPGLDVRLRGEKMSLRAREDKLTDILRRLAQAGVRVKIDPAVEADVSGEFADEDVQAALAALLEPFGYVLIWDVVGGPLGDLPRLAEIQVYRPGEKKRLELLAGTQENLDVTRGPAGGPKFVADEILIGFKPGTRRDAFERLMREIGGTVIGGVPELGVYQVRLAPGANVPALVDQLKDHPLVAAVEPNYVAEMPAPRSSGGAAEELDGVSVAPPRDGAAALAILDSGLMETPGLEDVIAGELDALNPDRKLADPVGHGTQMALIAAGAVDPAGGAGGEQESVPIVAIRAFDDNGNASSFGLMRSLAYAVDKGARVVNMSWGSETDSEFLKAAVDYAQSKGLILVAAAGNEPTQRTLYPAGYDGVVAVSALDESGKLWDQSNYGTFVSVSAPGKASFPVGHNGPPGAYAGTSISSAYVARALALYLSKHPDASRDDAVKALQRAVSDLGEKGRDAQYGYGALDADALARLIQ